MGQLAASVVHEINNPMTAVVAYAESLLQRALMRPGAEPADSEKLRKILESAQRILRFTRDLVVLRAAGEGQAGAGAAQRRAGQAVGYCEHVVAQATGEGGARLRASCRRSSAVRANLVQVFVNLITNACHAMQPGGQVYAVDDGGRGGRRWCG